RYTEPYGSVYSRSTCEVQEETKALGGMTRKMLEVVGGRPGGNAGRSRNGRSTFDGAGWRFHYRQRFPDGWRSNCRLLVWRACTENFIALSSRRLEGQGCRSLSSQPTIQPTIRVVLYDLLCVWQSPRACKLSFRASGPLNPM